MYFSLSITHAFPVEPSYQLPCKGLGSKIPSMSPLSHGALTKHPQPQLTLEGTEDAQLYGPS